MVIKNLIAKRECGGNRIMNRRIFQLISNFAKDHNLEIEFEFNCLGRLTIKMIRDEYSIRRIIDRFELIWLENCDDSILTQLYIMLAAINENYDKPL